MKVIIPVNNDKEGKNSIAGNFHNTEFVCIYDKIEQCFNWVESNTISAKPGNLSIEMKRKNIYTIICNHLSLMALGLFSESGIEVLKAQGSDLQQNIELYLNNKLQPLTRENVLFDSKCSSGCGSCKSTTCKDGSYL
ncbi:MAG: hypothetical protein SNJ71_01775 [Bacteroidales bacterium]